MNRQKALDWVNRGENLGDVLDIIFDQHDKAVASAVAIAVKPLKAKIKKLEKKNA